MKLTIKDAMEESDEKGRGCNLAVAERDEDHAEEADKHHDAVSDDDDDDNNNNNDDDDDDDNTLNTTTMPTTVYTLVWSFLLDSNRRNSPKVSFDLKTIYSFMLVNKTAMETFHECMGWNQCAEILKQEATCKRDAIVSYQERGSALTLATPSNVFRLLPSEELKAFKSFLSLADNMRKVDARLVRIQKVLFRKACHLAATNYSTDMDHLSRFSYSSTLEKSIRDVERQINIQPVLQHIAGLLGIALNAANGES